MEEPEHTLVRYKNNISLLFEKNKEDIRATKNKRCIRMGLNETQINNLKKLDVIEGTGVFHVT